MSKRFYVEQRASEKYPWQFVDITAGLRAGPISIHKTRRDAERARDRHKAMLKADAQRERRMLDARITTTDGEGR